MLTIKSMLFAPGNQQRKCAKAVTLGADVACFDLEDAVPQAEKELARVQVTEMLALNYPCPVFVRVNGMETPQCYLDLQAMVRPGLAGIVLPRFESQAHLRTVDWLLCALERAAGLQEGAIELMPVVETAIGLVNLGTLQDPPFRVKRLSFGAWDLTLDTGIVYTPDEEGIAVARSNVVVQSRAAKLKPPIDTSYPMLNDPAGLERSCIRAQSMGFGGKACLHPDQVEPVNRLFAPSLEALAEAREIVAAFVKSLAGGAAAVKVGGQFVDYPIYEKARRLLQRHEQS
jgi:citrate lyase subunit beta / citryl-CoA lyase